MEGLDYSPYRLDERCLHPSSRKSLFVTEYRTSFREFPPENVGESNRASLHQRRRVEHSKAQEQAAFTDHLSNEIYTNVMLSKPSMAKGDRKGDMWANAAAKLGNGKSPAGYVHVDANDERFRPTGRGRMVYREPRGTHKATRFDSLVLVDGDEEPSHTRVMHRRLTKAEQEKMIGCGKRSFVPVAEHPELLHLYPHSPTSMKATTHGVSFAPPPDA